MATELDIIGQEDPLYASFIKQYDTSELDSVIDYINITMQWMRDNNLDVSASEDIVTLRVGVPYLGSDQTVDANDIFLSDDNLDRLIASLGLDALKFTVNSNDNALPINNRVKSYTFKSPHIHKIFGKYFVDGVDNRTGFAYMDGLNISTSKLATVPVKYSGIEQISPIIPLDVPDFVVRCVVYILQNPRLVSTMTGEARVPAGDLVHFKSSNFYTALETARVKAENKVVVVSTANLPQNVENAIKQVLDTCGMSEAFTNLQYGGLAENLRVLIRMPASRAMQAILEDLLVKDEVFGDVFKEVFITMTDANVNESIRNSDLIDVYSGDIGTEENIEVSSDGMYGCKRTTEVTGTDENENEVTSSRNDYRHWLVSDAWLKTITPEKLAIVFWSGLDLEQDYDTNPCPYDKIIIVIIIIVVTVIAIIAAIPTGGQSLSAAQGIVIALSVASAVVGIGTTMGFIDKKTGTELSLALAVASLGTSLYSTTLQMVGMNLVTANLVVQTLSTTLSGFNLQLIYEQEEAEEIKKEADALIAQNAENNETAIKFVLGDGDWNYIMQEHSYGYAVDPLKDIKSHFHKMSCYRNKIA